jgi:hypothetical protein
MSCTALWSCTHIPNIIYLSGKTKKVMIRTSFAEKKQKKRKQKGEAEAEAEREAEEKIRQKQYVSLRSKGRHNYIIP